MSRFLFQFTLFLVPFVLFGLYRLAIAEAEQEGRKPWPIRALFGIGLGLFLASWVFFIMINRGDVEECYRPSKIENGVVVPGEAYPCPKDLSRAGDPLSDDPGGSASGVGDPDPAGPQ